MWKRVTEVSLHDDSQLILRLRESIGLPSTRSYFTGFENSISSALDDFGTSENDRRSGRRIINNYDVEKPKESRCQRKDGIGTVKSYHHGKMDTEYRSIQEVVIINTII